jgi:hypothetical protein
MPLPQRIANAPSLLPGLEVYYIGFMDLQASRQTGFGLGPLWWGTIQEYCEKKELSVEQTEAMHFHLRNLDTIFLKHHEKKAAKK